ncbi:MAG: T9SS type A sorting domain-containing protein [Bacteroidetes bacterium]|nr:T9SS type A sorting domain-containing protein [Bacteroidota bacterium]
MKALNFINFKKCGLVLLLAWSVLSTKGFAQVEHLRPAQNENHSFQLVDNAHSIAVDINADSYMDFITIGERINQNSPEIVIHLNQDGIISPFEANFQDLPRLMRSDWRSTVAFYDADADGFLDLFISIYPEKALWHFKTEIDEQGIPFFLYQQEWVFDDPNYLLSFAFGDINNDGFTDIVSNVGFLMNNGSSNRIEFSYRSLDDFFPNQNRVFDFSLLNRSTDNYRKFIHLVDFNNDGWLDIISAYNDSYFLNQNGQSFESVPLPIPATQILPVDINVDGSWDLAIVNATTGAFNSYLNEEQGLIQSGEEIDFFRFKDINAGDMFGNDRPDLAFSVITSTHIDSLTHLLVSTNSFGDNLDPFRYVPGTPANGGVLIDYNNDDVLDLFLMGWRKETDETEALLLENVSGAINQIPKAPENLRLEINPNQNNSIFIVYDTPAQVDTNQAFQTQTVDYELIDVTNNRTLLKAPALPTGRRLLSTTGALMNTGRIVLQELDPEIEYRIRVQFVDYGFKGSAFAEFDFQVPHFNFMIAEGFPKSGASESNLTWVDLEKDGSVEFLQTGMSNDQPISSFYNQNENGFYEISQDLNFRAFSDAQHKWLDLDFDNDADLIISGKLADNSYRLDVYKQENQTLVELEKVGLFAPITEQTRLRLLDMNQDGKLELLLIEPEEDVHVFEIIVSGNQAVFREMNMIWPVEKNQIYDVLVTDLTSNGLQDWLIIQRNNSNLDLVHFERQDRSTWNEFSTNNLLLNHLDKNKGLSLQKIKGRTVPECIVFGTTLFMDTQLKVLSFKSELKEWEQILQHTATASMDFAFSDVTLNGYPDLVLLKENTGSDAQFLLYENTSQGNGDRAFQLVEEGLQLINPVKQGSILIKDVNDDGKNDLLINGMNDQNEVELMLYMNGFDRIPSAPQVPQNLVVEHLDAESVRLSWASSMDPNSHSDALNYQVWIGNAESSTENSVVRTPEDQFPGFELETPIFSNSVTFHLPEGQSFFAAVQAIAAGNLFSDYSDPISFTTPVRAFKPLLDPQFEITNGTSRFIDINGDGIFDILSSGYDAFFGVSVNLWIGNLSDEDGLRYEKVDSAILPALGISRFTFGDINGDRLTDLVYSGIDENGIRHMGVYYLYRAGVGYSFGEPVQLLTGVINGDSKLFDADGDGDLDLVLVGSGVLGTVLEFYENVNSNPDSFRENPFQKVDGYFSPEIGYDFASVDVADVNNDGKLDVLISGNNYNQIGGRGLTTDIYINKNGQFILDEIASEGLPDNYHGQAKFIEMNNDGFVDVVVAGREGVRLSLHQGINESGDIQYRSVDLPVPASVGTRFDAADLNNDGFTDLVITGREFINNANTDPKKVWIVLNKGANGFELAPEEWISNLPASWNGWVELGDANQDGSVDILLTSDDRRNTSRVFLNQLSKMNTDEIQQNEAPNAPRNPRMYTENGETQLRWDFGGDDHTDAKAMKYNLRLTSNSQVDDVVKSNVSQDGAPYFVTNGNMVNRTKLAIPELDSTRTYEWAIQAIDQSGKHSEWAIGSTINSESVQHAELRLLLENGPLEKRINLVFLSEAWLEGERESFFEEARRMADSILAISPYKEYRTFINAHAIFVASEDNEISYWNGNESVERNTYFNAYRHNYGNANYITIPDADGKNAENLNDPGSREKGNYADGFGKVDQLMATLIPEFDLVMMLCKSNSIGGSAVLWQDRTIGFVGIPPFDRSGDRFKIARHELAHSLGLGDEYGDLGITDHFQANFPNVFLPSNEDAEIVKAEAPWNEWLSESAPFRFRADEQGLIDVTHGLFEGGQYTDRYYFRAHNSDIMRNYMANQFGAVNREWLIKAIYGYRWHVEGMPKPFHRIRPVRLIQQRNESTDLIEVNEENPLQLSIPLLFPAHGGGLSMIWKLDDERILTSSSSLQKTWEELPAGVHTLSFEVIDITPYSDEIPAYEFNNVASRRWVIPENDSLGYLKDEVSWIIDVIHPTSLDEDKSAHEIRLYPNYPNPFNPTTTIRFSLSQAMNVNLTVYDILGKKIQTLTNKVHSAGTQSFNFDASNLSSGIYFYRLETPMQTLIQKMMLIK